MRGCKKQLPLKEESRSLWSRILQAWYSQNQVIMQKMEPQPHASIWWNDQCHIVNNNANLWFNSHCKKVVGDDQSTRLWEDTWYSVVPLQYQFPRLYSISENKHHNIIEVFKCIDGRNGMEETVREGAVLA
ncbi:hypothetical protein VNO77_39178 [Canavalia gladiata]|uniref:Uncharacterized protein n=1 Tax=Canavalia gladiata TaxID=3824 RepID=A0AAN9PWW9_CANGL